MASNSNIINRKVIEFEVIIRDKTPKAKKPVAAVKPEVKAETPVAPAIKPLNDYSWAEIKEIARRGEAQTYFRIGDRKVITLPNNEDLVVAIAGFYHDKDKDGNLIPITFTTVNTTEEDMVMNDTTTNAGGWKDSKGRKSLEHFFSTCLPKDLQEVITAADKGDTLDKLFLFNEMEVFGRTIYSADTFGKQYPYYTEKHHRCKFKNSEESADWWWLRSPGRSNSTSFCIVNGVGGIAYYYFASFSSGVAFGFGI